LTPLALDWFYAAYRDFDRGVGFGGGGIFYAPAMGAARCAIVAIAIGRSHCGASTCGIG
jgi:hypothetical protein